ncbi:RNA polymeras-like protein II Elongator subunit [Myriangium duriaei CBS 260.36]|uniref:Elongator complex protein 2 n=1 Tax=Myriangium duriaei CBS 260.36 TaxID=1168546 RepID=A0A9P4MC74_9PEZI|nr:RNA polymeras-like protein II Elongator subunit [Myriangium duriaei CBS 260.36]
MLQFNQRHIAVGGNRYPAAADWQDGLFVFGSGKNVALWEPAATAGVKSLLRGHTDTVSAVKIISRHRRPPVIVSGSADKTVRLWALREDRFVEVFQSQHDGAVNTIAVLPEGDTFVTGAADATMKIWKLDEASSDSSVSISASLIQTIPLKPRFLPLATAVAALDDGSVVLVVAGTMTSIQMYHGNGSNFKLAATLTGHEGWIRSLDFVRESTTEGSDVLLASASQDKYIRLWRLHRGQQLPTASTASQDPSLGALGRSLSNKPHFIGEDESLHSVTFEALLIGHEDWIYTAQWKRAHGSDAGPELLTTSADNSVSIWRREVDSGFWICQTRLGEISSQKGSTTATGSAGGFWIGLWSPSGDKIASLGRTGSWRLWVFSSSSTSWEQQIGISGHIKEVKSLAWSADGSYLLTTGSDQTTRLLAPWRKEAEETWHEIARPQIHGYDLNCVDSLGTTQFISGADEKLLRVFNKPRSTAVLLGNLSGDQDSAFEDLPEIADIPVLGLSNKAMTADENEEKEGTTKSTPEAQQDSASKQASIETNHPPFEDLLSRYTLWPEHEKLYGHGYEISTVAASDDGKLVATACRASSIDHAVIRLYETKNWREIKPTLSSHSLTVTSLAFSPSNDRLLSVGRDRQWTVFERKSPDSITFEIQSNNPKGHSRMILDCTWAPLESSDVFATAGRDKSVKIWAKEDSTSGYNCKLTIPMSAAVTAVAFAKKSIGQGEVLLVSGSEEGEVLVARVNLSNWTVSRQTSLEVGQRPASAITSLRWRPQAADGQKDMLAVASEDHSVRLYDIVDETA